MIKDEGKIQDNEPISLEYITRVHEKFQIVKALSIIELTELAFDLARIDAPAYTVSLIEGFIAQKNGDYKNACDKLYQSYSESGLWQTFKDFLSCFMETMGAVDEKSKCAVIGVIINSITGFIKTIASSTKKDEIHDAQTIIAELSCVIGKILFNSDETLHQKEKIAKTWLDAVEKQTMITILLSLIHPQSAPVDTLWSRFFGYLLACAGAENELIKLHSGLNEKTKMLGLTFSDAKDKNPCGVIEAYIGQASFYINQAGFGTSPDIFCEQLLASQNYNEILDIGCGPGRIGENLEGRCKAVDGIDINPNYIEHASSRKIYRELFCGDANEELEKLSKTYDLITMCMILDYLPGENTIKLAAKLLKPSGLIAFAYMPSATYYENPHFSTTFYERNFFKELLPDFSIKKHIFKPYMWSGGYYVLLSK